MEHEKKRQKDVSLESQNLAAAKTKISSERKYQQKVHQIQLLQKQEQNKTNVFILFYYV